MTEDEKAWQDSYNRMRELLKALMSTVFRDEKKFDRSNNKRALTVEAIDRVQALRDGIVATKHLAAPYYSVKLCAKQDINGNPRRGWLVYNREADLVGFVDEGYVGERALFNRFPGVRTLCWLNCSVSDYNIAMREEKRRAKEV